MFTSGCATSLRPVSSSPGRAWKTPGGAPASANSSAISSAPVSGVSGAGFRTTVLPSASAGATTRKPSTTGKFHGVIAATTPTGTRWMRLSLPVLWEGSTSAVARDVSAAAS